VTNTATALAASRRISHREQLARAARLRPEAVAFQFEDTRRSYAKLDDRVARPARALAARGTGRGGRVAVLVQNGLELVKVYFAACRLGAIAVPVSFRLVTDEVAYVLADAEARALVVDREPAPTAAPAREAAPNLRAVLATGGAEATPGLGTEP
jgi:fatty-acyl-CoA synthase